MTDKKRLKARVRARMARTGESYTAARRHVVGETPVPTDGAWRFLGGQHPNSSVIASVLANGGFPISEPLVFLAGGGLGAGYILWQFKEHGVHLTLGFSNRWQYYGAEMDTTLARLDVSHDVHTTGGARGASTRLAAELDAGRPCVILPDRYHVGYWHLPPHLDGHGGHPVIAYRRDGDAVRLDDRGRAPLVVARERLDRARSRVGSYKNVLYTLEPAPIPEGRLVHAVGAGLRDCVEHLGGSSDSFSLPAWRKWARLMTDTKNAKGWPRVFAGGTGAVGALLSAWEGVEPVGADGGNLRDLFAGALDEAADLLGVPALRDHAEEFRRIHLMWHDLAEVALPADVPALARMRELTAEVRESILADGTAAEAETARAAAELWDLRATADETVSPGDLDALFADIGARLLAVHEAETAAVARLRESVPRE